MVSEERGLPDTFDPRTGRNVQWSAELGTETHATPIVAGGRVYIGTNNGHPRDPAQQGDRGILMCFDERTGRFLWQMVFLKRDEDIYFDWPRSGIASPVTVEDGRVYFVNNRGEVICLEPPPIPEKAEGGAAKTETANLPAPRILWQFDLTAGAGIWSHDGAHSPILINGDYLYLNTGTGVDNTHRRIRTPDAPSLVVLDKRTGRLVARENEGIAPNIFHATWAGPALAAINGQPRLFFAAGNGIVYAFETLPNRGPENRKTRTAPASPSGSPTGAAASRSPAFLQQVWRFDFDPAAPKTNIHLYVSNRRESPSTFYGMPVFHHNRLYLAGGGDLWWGKHEAWLNCFEATGTGDITPHALAWSYPLQKHVLATPAIWRGLVFIADCGRMFHCVDAQTGQPCWTHELKGEAWASPLVADGKVYLGTRGGSFYVFAAERDKKVLATVALERPISATATAANGALYVATMDRLYALRQGVGAQ
ncbi:MAG TPA: PQQ-binding-like beta-propeller repeat protein [Verrucomicrobiota bacterium]|mgnify:FL=1|jgi:outer membrane protein assembly factor BamB|nr:PQQ-binding-like beta-propeller repeat protein [Verrucomicrobiota bacterium]HNW07978.1 PQQ-binding-like beta-propeller repeat protein [Verrucomicrobiota bacterium]HNZ76559.1 PQQ-binding-like beta-propeller repeat protein [Verrucomicrobiota bacterium]HOC51489.1 PQQ-binding-like beta-propeller repeat protein [Verrucomicrobiota bacterium]HOH40893.1 PQQ-binding-like beta-propeller repeat protein [Verrucomicrobiota bacterium]